MLETTLTIEQTKKIFALYWNAQCSFLWKGKEAFPYFVDTIVFTKMDLHKKYGFTNFNLHLIPLPAMSEQQILDLCKEASPSTFGDYRFTKWKVIPNYENDGKFWQSVNVKNEKVDEYFQIDLIDGTITIYDETGSIDPTLVVDHAYWQWYLENSIAIPIRPWGKTPIELGVAIDKTKL